MNYLSHLYLGRGSDAFMLGSFLGDFIRGPAAGVGLPPEIEAGVRFHREIDAVTDRHPAFHDARVRLIAPDRRRFAGILVDIFLDHFLSVEWGRWEPDEDLGSFIERCYEVIGGGAGYFPEGARIVLPRMRDENWLGSYGTMAGIRTTLVRVSRRSPRVAGLVDGTADLVRNYDAFHDVFEVLFPDLVAMIPRGEGATAPGS